MLLQIIILHSKINSITTDFLAWSNLGDIFLLIEAESIRVSFVRETGLASFQQHFSSTTDPFPRKDFYSLSLDTTAGCRQVKNPRFPDVYL